MDKGWGQQRSDGCGRLIRRGLAAGAFVFLGALPASGMAGLTQPVDQSLGKNATGTLSSPDQAPAPWAGQTGYEVLINGQPYTLQLGQRLNTRDEAGRPLELSLRKLPFQRFDDAQVSFLHRSEFNVVRKDLDAGISQLLLSTATSSLIIIQEYSSLDPSSLNEMLLKEMIKESLEYGYTQTRKPVEQRLASGRTLKGIRSTLRLKAEESFWEVVSYGKKDQGVVIMTHMDKSFAQEDQHLLDTFWKSLILKY